MIFPSMKPQSLWLSVTVNVCIDIYRTRAQYVNLQQEVHLVQIMRARIPCCVFLAHTNMYVSTLEMQLSFNESTRIHEERKITSIFILFNDIKNKRFERYLKLVLSTFVEHQFGTSHTHFKCRCSQFHNKKHEMI